MTAAVSAHAITDREAQRRVKSRYQEALTTLKTTRPELAKVIKRKWSGKGWESAGKGVELINRLTFFRDHVTADRNRIILKPRIPSYQFTNEVFTGVSGEWVVTETPTGTLMTSYRPKAGNPAPNPRPDRKAAALPFQMPEVTEEGMKALKKTQAIMLASDPVSESPYGFLLSGRTLKPETMQRAGEIYQEIQRRKAAHQSPFIIFQRGNAHE